MGVGTPRHLVVDEPSISEASYIPIRYLIERKDMTFILGSKCSDGVVLIGDRKITTADGSYEGYGDKIFQNIDGVVWGAAGALNYFNSFKERVRVEIEDRGGAIPARHFLPLIEKVHGQLIQTFQGYFINRFQILIAPRTGADTALYLVEGIGGHSLIEKYQAIGSGSPYGELFLKKLWKPEWGMKQVAELGCFIIQMIEKFHLDASVGVGDGHPQVWFLPNNPQPVGSTYGTDLSIRPANESELNMMAQTAKEKVDRFDNQVEALLNSKLVVRDSQ